MLARRERVADVNAARQWLVAQDWVMRDRISLIGWAHGASTVLWAVRPQLAARGLEPDYRSAIAFYPDCRISSGTGWSARVPTLLLIGASDDVSSPSSCKPMVDNARGRSALARIVVYPGAEHDFDRAENARRGRWGLIRRRRSAAVSAPMRRRARTRRSASRTGWRGEVSLPSPGAGRVGSHEAKRNAKRGGVQSLHSGTVSSGETVTPLRSRISLRFNANRPSPSRGG